MATTPNVNVTAIENAKETYKIALLKQIEPIDQQIAELKKQLAVLENSKRTVQAQINLLDRKPATGRVWSAEAKAKLSQSLKAAAARKKAAQAGAATATPAAQGTQAPAPVTDAKMRAANDDSAPATSTPKKRTGSK
jgi:septal ring factor EnvC (AmiA/AmiB activator)